MNQLAQLKIVGTVTPCTTNVWIQNQIIGAQLHWIINNVDHPGPVATAAYQSFPLPPVKQNDKVSARQRAAGYLDSPPVDVPLQQPPTPQELSKGQFAPFFICVNSVLLEGLFPDGAVQVLSGGKVLGQGSVRGDGRIEVPLNRAIKKTDQLAAVQTVCKNSSAVPIAALAPQPLPQKLSVPAVAPAFACDTFIAVSNFTAGATVKVTLNGAQKPIISASVPLSFFTLALPALKTNDTITVEASIPPGCDTPALAPQSSKIVVGGGAPAPDIGAPLCEKQTYVEVVSIRMGALVELTVTGQNPQFFGASAATVFCNTAPLPFPGVVAALQNTCGGNQWTSSPKAKINPLAPLQITLFSPQDGAMNEMLQPTLQWDSKDSGCNEASSFDIQISTDPGFVANVANVNGFVTSMNVFSLKNNLLYSTLYHWRVRAHANKLQGLWSTPFRFTTIPQPTDPGAVDKSDLMPRDRYFVEDCCPNFRKVVTAFGPHDKAYAKVVMNAASTCSVSPLEVDANFKVDPC